MSGGRGESPYNEADEPRRLNSTELCANGHNCGIAARSLHKNGNALAAAGFEIAAALYHCTLHLVDTFSMVLVQTCDTED